ncbi:Polycomb group RING finger protein 6 [Exaiptasia diaphana]|nr:Polycomb group RING finger protein 6 [Exaiptasia diaphana]
MMMSIEQKRRKIRIRDLNPHLTCMLCKGYFVNPVTITECIHTFCKSCLVRHISLVNKCPSCGIVIHETQPVYNIRSDRTMQDIINKILPRIEHDERKREKRFYKTKGLPYPASPLRAPFSNSSMLKEQKTKLLPTKSLANLSKPVVKAPSIGHLHHSTDQISLQLEYSSLEKTLDGLENGLQVLLEQKYCYQEILLLSIFNHIVLHLIFCDFLMCFSHYPRTLFVVLHTLLLDYYSDLLQLNYSWNQKELLQLHIMRLRWTRNLR